MISAGVIIGNIVAANAGTFSLLVTAIANIINLNAQRITVGEFNEARLPAGSRPAAIAQAIQNAVDALPDNFDPDTFDWTMLATTIPFNVISGVRIQQNQIAAGAVIANLGGFTALAAQIARVIELNANRITTGILGAAHVDADVQTVVPIFSGNLEVGNTIATFNLPTGYTLLDLVPDISENQGASMIYGVGRPREGTATGIAYAPWAIKVSELQVGSDEARLSNAKTITVVTGSAGTNTGECYIWTNRERNKIFMTERERNEGIFIHSIVAVKNPPAGSSGTGGSTSGGTPTPDPDPPSGNTRTVYRYIRSSTLPNNPGIQGSGVADWVPNGWSTSDPGPTTTQNVYRISRVETLNNGVFVSATAWVWDPGPSSAQPFRSRTAPPAVPNAVFVLNLANGVSGRIGTSEIVTWDVTRTGFLSTIEAGDAGHGSSITGAITATDSATSYGAANGGELNCAGSGWFWGIRTNGGVYIVRAGTSTSVPNSGILTFTFNSS